MARKLKQSVINSIPHLKENLEEEEKKKRRLKQSVYEEMPYLDGKINDDVAPVGGNQNTWVKSGGFSDGVDGVGDFFGDLGQTVAGTVGDVGLGILKGAGRLVEGVVDLGTYGVAGAADLVGADEFADEARRVARYSAVDEWTKPATDFVDRYSVLGNKADAISEGLGQVGAIILTGGAAAAGGLGAVGATALTTGVTGLSGWGSGMGQAYEEGASDEEAALYGFGAGMLEAGTELLFGGLGKGVKALGLSRGIGGLDDMFAKKLSSAVTRAIKNDAVQKVAGNTIEAAIKAGGEGLEEVLSGLGSAVMKKLTYEDDESLQKLIEDENLLEQFVVGAVTSSIAQSPSYIQANKSGRDFVTGYTSNEQTVIDKEVEKRVAEQEKSGKKLSKKEIGAIEEQVMEDMEHGQIDLETIEEVLGGESYTTYKDTVKSEDDLKAEYEQLANIKKSDLTTKQEERLAELKAMNLGDTTKRDDLRKKLNETVFPQLKESKLEESYNQIAKKGEKFTADLSQYKGKQREAVERAVNSGVLNNTYHSHVLVDTLSKIEADKGIKFDYTNNAKLKEAGRDVFGYTVNGFYDEKAGTVTVNMQSTKAWQSVVGHEVTHVLEGTEAYTALRDAVYAYAKSKGDYDGRFAEVTKLYEGKADIDSELTADLIGDYLFTDKAFVDHIVTNKNIFQRIWDEIKYLCRVATGKQLTEVEKVQREFDRAWKEYSSNTESEEYSDSDVKYSLRKEAPPKETGVAYKVFYVKDGKLYPPMVANPEGADTPMGVWLNADVGTAAPPSKTGRAQVKAGGKGTQGGSGSLAFRPGWHLGDLPRASQFDRLNPETGKKELFPENFVWAEVEYAKDVDYQEEAMSYGYTENGKFRHAYAGLPRLPENGYYRYRTNPKPDTVPWVITGAMKVNRLLSDAEVNEILEKNGVPPVHRQGGDVGLEKFGFGENDGVKDSDGNQLSEEQQEYFKGSKVRDENGNLKVMYHGTPRGDFTVFRDGTYFTEHKWYADLYQNPGASSINSRKTVTNPKTYEVYLDIKKPFDISDPEARDIYINEYIKGGNAAGINPYLSDAEYAKIKTVDWTEGEDLREFLIDNEYDYDGLVLDEGAVGGYGDEVKYRGNSYVIFSPEQVKDVGNKKPTADPDIRFSLSKPVEETKDLVALHNLDASSLLETLKLSGLPSPSVAIVKAKDGHEKYGDVSLILPKEAIDPQANSANRIYGSDAWTPTRANAPVEYEVDYGVKRQFESTVEQLANNVANGIFSKSSVLGAAGIEGSTDKNLDDIAKRISDYDAVKAAYVADNGKNVEIVYREKEFDSYGNNVLKNYIDKVGEQELARLSAQMITGERLTTEEIETAKDVIVEDWTARHEWSLKRKPELRETRTAKFRDGLSHLRVEDFVRHAWEFYEDSGATTEDVDRSATATNLDAVANRADVEAWVVKKLQGLLGEPAIYNGKDPFTPSGKPRSFKELHWEYTAENIVRAMNEADARGANMWNVSGDAVIATATPEYKNIDEVRADKDRLYKADDDIYKQIEDDITAELQTVTRDIVRSTEHRSDNQYDEEQNIGRVIMEAAQTTKTPAKVKQVFRKNGYTINDAQAKSVIALFKHASSVPTGYFEAKPQRVVGFDEVGVYVIPNNADVKLKQELLNRGYAIAEYDPDVEGSRQKVVNQFEEYKFSLSNVGEEYHPVGNYSTPLNELAYEDIAPVANTPTVQNNTPTTRANTPTVPENTPTAEEEHPLSETGEDIIKTVKERLNAKIENSEKQLEETELLRDWVKASYEHKIEKLQAQYDSKKNKDTKVAVGIQQRISNLRRIAADLDADIQKKISAIETRISNTSERLQNPTKRDILEVRYEKINNRLEADKASLAEDFAKRKAEAQEALADRTTYFSNKATDLYNEVRSMRKGVRVSPELGYILDNLDLGAENKAEAYKALRNALLNTKYRPGSLVDSNSAIERFVRDTLHEYYENDVADLNDMDSQYQQEVERLEADAEKQRESARKDEERVRRSALHESIINNAKAAFGGNGFDFDDVLAKAKNLSTFATVDNTPQRVMEKALGYKEGGVLADLTVNKVAQNESAGIKWLNSFTDRKNGLIAQISKQYRIKPGSKESAAAQMYAEGFYVNDNNEIIAYGDAELARDFPNAGVQDRIKGLAHDPRIRQIYDETLDAINASRTRNAYPEIQKLDNYFLHFRAMDDTFSRLGLPFNPNDIRAKDLPTDLNGVTADLKPGQPYFASANHRTGKRTSFDLLGGLERYLTSAKNQIYHIDDIQTLRALRNYIADTYGQANGLEGIDVLTEEEAQERIEMVYNSHLSTFAKFLNEEANVLAGKTALIDRGLEGIIGRRGMTFLDTVNRQVGSNMVGFNISSSLTNFLPVAQTLAKTNKFDFLKAFAQTSSSKLASIFGKSNNFAENSPVIIRRKGADRFYRTPWQKAGDAGYVLMSAVDDISTELIARTKYNELTRKGMDSQTAHFETDKWVSRLLGDRSLGQQPQLFNSKTLGIFTKFQLEVRNQLDSQFYDTIQEAKVSSEHIQNALARNARTAAKVTSTFVQLAVVQHLFGKAFESVAGYNPAFDIISTLATVFGFDDEEDSEDTVLDNVEQGFLDLLEDLPYTSTFTGGRIPISSALPIKEVIKGVDEYGNEKSRLETIGEAAPYYILPGGYGQIKKTAAGRNMFSDEHPVSGSYTDSGKLRFPVEDTPENRVQAAIFGQYASENAREYFDNNYAPLDKKQIQEYIDTDIPIGDYRDYREGLKGLTKLEEKLDYISDLDLPVSKKNILANNLTDRKEPIDLTNYDDFGSLEEFDFANKNPEKYSFAKSVGGYSAYKGYSDALGDIKADKDANGKSISGSRKEKVLQYINNLDADYYTRIILFKSEYPSEDSYNGEIIEYLNGRDDLSYEDRVSILTELGFRVTADGQIYAD